MHTTSFPLAFYSSQEGEPPRKKRRSKWDIQPEDLTTANTNHNSTPQAPTSAAAAAAAKLNAKLASEGKLKPASTVYMVSLSQPAGDRPNPYPISHHSTHPQHIHIPCVHLCLFLALTAPTLSVSQPASSSVLSPSPNSLASSLLPPSHGSATTVVGNLGPASATIDINDLDVR